MPEQRFQLTRNENGTHTVLVDGHDISHSVAAIQIESTPRETSVTLQLVHGVNEIDVFATVKTG